MFSLDPKRGMFDLSWRMFGTPVIVRIWFWVVMGVFGYFMGIRELDRFVAWVLVAFVSTMIHEFGHIAAGRVFGYPGVIVLHAMGGGAIGEYLRAHRWQRILIAAAGPIAGLTFYLGIYVAAPLLIARLSFFGQWEELAFVTLCYLAFMSLFANLSNLPPILPMDGGMIAKDLSGYVVGRRDWFFGALISIATAGTIVAYSLYKRSNPDAPFVATLFRPLYPFSLRNTIYASIDPDPLFLAVMYGLMGAMNVFALFRRPAAPASD